MKIKTIASLFMCASISFTSMLANAGIELKMVTDSGTKDSPSGQAIKRWAELIEEGTGGEISTRVFYQNQLGGQQDVFDQFMAGDVQIMLNFPMTSYDKRISVIYTPYMFTTWDEALEAYKTGGWLTTVLDSLYQQNGLKFFGAWPEGFNGVGTRGSFATTTEEASKLKVRVPPIFPFLETTQALGYQTASIDWGEVFTSIQTGVVDGDAANVIFYEYEYFRDTLDYYVNSRQQFITAALSMNLDAWNKLDSKQQKVVRNAAQVIMKDQFKNAELEDNNNINKWEKAGKEYIEVESAELADLAKIVRAAVWPMMEKEIGSELMSLIENNAKKF